GSSGKKASWERIIAWFEHHMRWLLITALGTPVEPEVNRNLAMVSGPTAACARSSAAPGSASGRASITSTPRAAASGAFWKGSFCETKTRPGVSSSKIDFSLAKSVDSNEYAGDTGA